MHAKRDAADWMPGQRDRILQGSLGGTLCDASFEVHVHRQKLREEGVDVPIISDMKGRHISRAKLEEHCVGELVYALVHAEGPSS